MDSETQTLVRRFQRVLAGSALPEQVKNHSGRALPRQLDAHWRLPCNRDGRGVRRDVAKKARTAIRQLIRAVGHANNHDDGNVRREARELLRSVQHVDFEEIQVLTSRFVGILNKAGHRREERKRQEKARRLAVADGYRLIELTVETLRSTGGELGGLCVAHNNWEGRGYHRALKDGSSEFWRLEKHGRVIGLIELDVESRKVADIRGKHNDAPKLERRVALALLQALDATGDDVETFAQAGAFRVFLDGTPQPDAEAVHDNRTYEVWCFRKRRTIIVSCRKPPRHTAERPIRGRRRPGRRRPLPGRSRALPRARSETIWTVFEPEEDFVDLDDEPAPSAARSEPESLADWSRSSWHRGAMTVGELFDLCLRCPDVGVAIRRAFA